MYMEFLILLNHRSLKIINHNAIFKWSYKTETYSQFCFIGTLGVPRISHYKDLDVSRASRFFTNEKSSLHILEHCLRA
ncbi:unnamed protein product [Brassica oleracea var. botrytis]